MDRTRLILALALSLVVLMSWPLVMRYPAPPPPIEETINFEEPAPETPPHTQKPPTASSVNKIPSSSSNPTAQAQSQTTQVEPREITIHTPNWTVKMSNRGAIATSWKLLKYVENGQVRNITGADGGELELIPQSLPPSVEPALSLRTPWAPEVGSQLNNVNFQIEGVAPGENDIRLE